MIPAIRIATFATATLALSLAPAPVAPPRVSTLPSRLADTTFWRMITEFSEPGGYFRSDNFISNEGELQYVIGDLQRAGARGRAYVGVGPEQNLTYIAALDPSIAFVVDIRRQNMIQHLVFKGLMELSPDRATYLSRLLSRQRPAGLDSATSVIELMQAYAMMPGDTAIFRRTLEDVRTHLMDVNGFTLSPEDLESMRYILSAFGTAGTAITYSFGQMGGPGRFGSWMPTLHEMMTETDDAGVHRSYLASEAGYRYLKDRQERNLIIPVVGDFGGDHALRAVARWLESQGEVLGVFYSSNVEQYLFQDERAPAAFYASLDAFPTDSLSTFVRSASNRGWVQMRNPRSRMAQLTMRIDPMLVAIKGGRVMNYGELLTLVP
jgi:hypothetical protein